MEQVVTTHRNTDFDALASSVCATLLYPGAVVVLPRAVNPNVRAFLSIHKDVFETLTWDEIPPDGVRRLIVVDVNQWSRLGRIRSLRGRTDMDVILWDHHLIEGDIEARWSCVRPMGATITLMIQRLAEAEIPFSPMHATLFLAGLYEDTGSLMFPSTTAEDARAAAFLLEHEADLNIVGNLLRPAYGERQKEILFNMLQGAERLFVSGYTVSVSRQAISGHVNSLSVVVHMYRQIMNVDAAFGIFTTPDDRCIVIGRSGIDALDMGAIMRNLGGGGHPGAGSALLKSVNPDSITEMLLDLVRGNGQASVRVGDLMSFPVDTIPPETPMREVAMLLREKGCTGLPVVDGDGKIQGVISRRDFRKLRKDAQLDAPVKAYMSRSVVTIDPSKSPMQAARLMVRHDIGRLPVVENERLIGIMTRSDAMTYFYDLLPT